MNRRERPGINIEKRGRTCSFDFSSSAKGLPKKTRQRVEAFLFLKKQRFKNNYSAQLNVFKKKDAELVLRETGPRSGLREPKAATVFDADTLPLEHLSGAVLSIGICCQTKPSEWFFSYSGMAPKLWMIWYLHLSFNAMLGLSKPNFKHSVLICCKEHHREILLAFLSRWGLQSDKPTHESMVSNHCQCYEILPRLLLFCPDSESFQHDFLDKAKNQATCLALWKL